MNFEIFAGKSALKRINTEGFHADLFGTILGASGAAKWLSISRLETVLFPWTLTRKTPLDAMGSSIGAWRMMCLAQRDPATALLRLENAYIHQSYPENWQPSDVDAEGQKILKSALGENGVHEIFSQDLVNLHLLAVRCRGFLAAQRKSLLLIGLAQASLANFISRSHLGWSFHRACFVKDLQRSAIKFRDLPSDYPKLTAQNLEAALIASGSIPLVSSPVREISGVAPGIYRDGGLSDYHFDFQFQTDNRLILYPHFYSDMIPGWFDKALPWRKVQGKALDQVVLICPSREFVESLPYKKIPDRNDFLNLDESTRLKYWRETVSKGQKMADNLHRLLEQNRLSEIIQPITG